MIKRFTLILFIFVGFVLSLIVTARSVSIKRERLGKYEVKAQNADTSDFQIVQYFLWRDNRAQFHLDAQAIRLVNNDQMTAKMPQGEAYSDDGTPIYFAAKIGRLNRLKNQFSLQDEVQMNFKTMQINGRLGTYFQQTDLVQVRDQVVTSFVSEKTEDTIKIKASMVDAHPTREWALFKGNKVDGQIIRKRAYEPGVDFSSRELEVILKQSLIELRQEVFFKKQDLSAESLRAEIFLENYNKKLKYYVLYDDVKLVQKFKNPDGSTLLRKGFCEKMEGFMHSEEAVLYGSPKLISGTDVVTGNRIVLKERGRLVEIDDNKSSVKMQKKMN